MSCSLSSQEGAASFCLSLPKLKLRLIVLSMTVQSPTAKSVNDTWTCQNCDFLPSCVSAIHPSTQMLEHARKKRHTVLQTRTTTEMWVWRDK